MTMTTPSQVPRNSYKLVTRRSGSSFNNSWIFNKLTLGVIFFLLSYSLFLYKSLESASLGSSSLSSQQQQQPSIHDENQQSTQRKVTEAIVHPESKSSAASSATNAETPPSCAFRHYPPRRYYGLTSREQPAFLSEAEYIYGELPSVLSTSFEMEKLCVNQSEWLTKEDTGRLPFADGTNPSILHVERLKDTPHYDDLLTQGVTYIATICMTNSQCQWNDTDEEVEEYNLSKRDKPNTVLTALLFLNEHFSVIRETTIAMQRDAVWGNRKLRPEPDGNGGFVTTVRALDDARLFVYMGKVWVSYRDGKAFGYDKQVLNPLHIEGTSVTIKASETLSFCCGRNMALMTPAENLQALTWVDPVTVIDVHTISESHRRLREADKTKKSHVHGTNAFMVPFGDNELLGMAHFHRPADRKENPYARFGHHYTHAFFTISASPPFRLTRLSAELLLPSKHHSDDGEIIQFISGLEVHSDKVVLAWGINDCEGAAGTIDVTAVEGLLRDVAEGKEVVDFMEKVSQ